MKKIISLIILFLITMLFFNNLKNTSAASTGMTFDLNDNYQSVKALEAMPKSYEAVLNIPRTIDSSPGVIYSNLGYNTFEDFYSFEVHYANNKAYPVLYLDVDNVDGRNIETAKFEFTDINLASSSRVQVTITLDTTNEEATVAKCYLNGSLMQTLEKKLPAEYNNLNYVPKTPAKLGSCYDGKFGSPYDTVNTSTYFKGEIYKLSLYKHTRTLEEIEAGVNLKDKNLLAHYELDNSNVGQDILDLTSNHYDLKYTKLFFDKEPAKDYAYSFAVVGDTQSLCELHTKHMDTLYDWIIKNKDDKKIKYVIGLGDITEGDHDWEWVVAKNTISKLDGVIPYSLIRGNHDTSPQFNKTFANDTYMNQFSGFYKEGDVNASYRLLKIGSTNYLFLTLNYGAFDDELNWACNIIEKYPNHKVVISTHAYLYSTGERLNSTNGLRPKTSNDDDFKFGHVTNVTDAAYNNGNQIWEKLVSKYANISLVLSGHVNTSNVVVSQDVGVHGNVVTQMLVNPQDMEKSASIAKVDGYGMVCMLYFNEDGSEMQVEYISTVQEKYFLTNNQYSVDLSKSGASAHNYLYKYNSIFHWQECDGCAKKDLTSQTKHTYDNACDEVCECGYTREASSHSFVDSFDDEGHYKACENCGLIDESTIKKHVFDNDCDSTCNSCLYSRGSQHKYTNMLYDKLQHWLECSVCGKIDDSSISAHSFEHDCDIDCKDCDYTRTTSHNYSETKNDGTNYWKECVSCGEKLPVDAPEDGCGGSLFASSFGLIIILTSMVVLKNLRKKEAYDNE
jgi:hypothetical protein